MKRIVGVVLAGGLSRRYGSPKAFAKLESRFFYEIAVDVLKELCDEIVVVTRQEFVNRFPASLTVIVDVKEFGGLGPLAGIYSAMEAIKADQYVVLPCDMPYMKREVMRNLLVRHKKGTTAVVAEGKQHPLVSIWDAETKATIQEALRNHQLRVIQTLTACSVTWIEGDTLTKDTARTFVNVNTPNRLERI
ncbi:molybdenum cofactor guanylyltransferase [Sporosarcina sp. HYO08]|uniref:molybdenum cofactor guanylyltransferase n=1 Tax=Sporosarcina sp. HYO08 TaxID=1759557 RepID=UPI0009E6B250|nr:molybdenum cofactor guanylyltransferase [Sporosarcina sp. HYO08]